MEKIFEWDRELYLFLNNLGNPTWDVFWMLITYKWSWIPFYAFLLYLIFKKFGAKGTLITAVVIALLITASDQLANVFKHGFERPRPCRQEGVMEYARFIAERCGRFGYFSAHAASSTGLAVFVGLLLKMPYPKMPYLMLIWAAIVSYSRIYVGVHYPLDVVTGMLIGALLGYLFYKLQLFLIQKFNVNF
jgi:undecaprenyl-diphosphatase